jgi:hypothetical protein
MAFVLGVSTLVAPPAAHESLDMRKAADAVATLIEPILAERGFVRQGLRWYRREEDSVLVVDVQAARFSPGPYLNFGAYYHQYGSLEMPPLAECQVWTRLNSLVPDPRRVDELLDMSKAIDAEQRGTELRETIRRYALPWLEGIRTLDDAKAFLSLNTSKAVLILPVARPDLDSKYIPAP